MSQNIFNLGTHDRWKRNTKFYEVEQMMKAMSGDMAFRVTPATDAPAPTEEAWEQDVLIELVDSAGNLHSWYSGPIKLAIADGSTLGTATIDPAGTTPDMVNGKYTVTIKGDAASWLNTETATLTVSDPDTVGIMGQVVADKTCVITFTTP